MKKLIIFMFLIMTLALPNIHVIASYNYTPRGEVIESANSMRVSRVIDNSNFIDIEGNPSPIALGNLRDIYTYNDQIFIVNATTHQVLVLNSDYRLVNVFPKEVDGVVEESHKLNNPNGIFVINDKLYVSDTDHHRIAVFDLETQDLLFEVKDPDDPIFDNARFRPLKIAVDRTGRMRVIAHDIFEGIMEFNPDGSFNRYFGTNTVPMSIFETLVYRLSSERQRSRQALRLQTSFVNLDIDQNGYIYTVSRPDVFDVVKKMNFKGIDILNRNGYVAPVGDVDFANNSRLVPTGRSNLVDITVREDGNMFSVLDSNRGRIFTYDNEGNLLYIFGQIGSQSDMFRRPESITYYGDRILAVDSMNRSLLVFEPTHFGSLINQAVDLYLLNQYSEAESVWQEVLALNSNYFLAYAGIGKAQLRSGNYEEAMVNLKIGFDYYNYSMAYERYRNERLNVVLPYILVITFTGTIYLFYRSIKSSVRREAEGGE